MNVANIQTAYYMVAATGVLIAAIFYIINLRYNIKARDWDICRFYVDFTSEQGILRYVELLNMEWKDSEDFMKKYGLSNPEMSAKWLSHFAAMETLGVLVKDKVVTAEKLFELGGIGCVPIWEKFKNIIQGMRKIRTDKDYFSNAEFLAHEMVKIKTRKDPDFKLETYMRTMKP